MSKGKYYSGKYIEAFIKQDKNKQFNFLGIAVSVKIGKAVKRNLIKRLIRENYKEIENLLKKGYEIVFLWKKKADTNNANFKNIKEDMYKIIEKADLLVRKETKQ